VNLSRQACAKKIRKKVFDRLSQASKRNDEPHREHGIEGADGDDGKLQRFDHGCSLPSDMQHRIAQQSNHA
jgi:hypothetical protein